MGILLAILQYSLLLMFATTCGVAQLSYSSPPAPLGTTRIDQMTYDPTNRTLYLTSNLHSIIQTTTPPNASPWVYSIAAGVLGTVGAPNLTEVSAVSAYFCEPQGVVGWPRYVVGPFRSSLAVDGAMTWVGLWVCDTGNSAVRFINFQRGSNVTLVAGSHTGTSGTVDGVGAAARLRNPRNVVWGRFLFATAVRDSVASLASREIFTSVMYWTDYSGHCIRQGVPLHNQSYLPLDGSPSESLEDMVLNVSTFAGVCGNPGGSEGWAYQRPVLQNPWGIALVNPFATLSSRSRMINPATVLFIAEDINHRVSMIAPLYPRMVRYLTAVVSAAYAHGISIGSVHLRGTSTAATILLFVSLGGYAHCFINVTVPVVFNANGSIFLDRNMTNQQLPANGIDDTNNAVFVRYTPNNTYNGTLVVFGGKNWAVLQFYCCLDAEYSNPLPLTAVVTTATPTPTLTSSLSASRAVIGFPLRSTINAFGTSRIDQMAYDPINQTLYLVNQGCSTIIRTTMSAAPLMPYDAAPWQFTVLAGQNGSSGLPSLTEVQPSEARFNYPQGVIGWPSYAVGPSLYPSGDLKWIGLWIGDFNNNAVRFINFLRGGNVTLVAGSSVGRSGTADGVGAAARFWSPTNLAWGRFPRMTAFSGGTALEKTTAWTSVIYWSDFENHCVRQGVPLRNQTLLPLDGSPTEALGDMVLDVTTFAGACGTNGSGTGATYNRPVLQRPWGVALVNPFLSVARRASKTDTVVLFVGDDWNNRVVMITPMYPVSGRYLIPVYTGIWNAGLTVGRLRSASLGGGDATAAVELYLGNGGRDFYNVSLILHYHAIDGVVNVSSGSVTCKNVFKSSRWHQFSIHSTFLRYTPNRDFNGTLVVLSWLNFGTGEPVLQFYCCLDAEYSNPLPLTAVVTTATPTISFTGSSMTSTQRLLGTRTTASRSRSVSRRTMTPSESPSRGVSETTSEQCHSMTASPSATASITATRTIPLAPLASSSVTALAVATTSSTSIAVSSMAFVATTPVMGLQRINGLLATQSCGSWEMNRRPSVIYNPTQETLGDGRRTVGAVLASCWRLSWVWVLMFHFITFLVMALGSAAEVAVHMLRKSKEENETESQGGLRRGSYHQVTSNRATR